MRTAVSMVLLLLVIYQAVNFQRVIAYSQRKIVESYHVRSDIRYRLATTQVESVIRNVAGVTQEIVFAVTLPKEAFIVDFFMDIDRKIYKGQVKEKTKFKKPYQSAFEFGQSAGNVIQAPRHSNIFEVSANVESGSAANFTLTYQEMLRRKLGVYKHEIHVNPGQAVNDFLIEVFIQENTPLRIVKTPALRKGSLITNKIEAENRLITVDRPSAEAAHITYRPSVADQSNANTPAIFMVEYDVEHSLQGEVMVVDGYFVHFFSPNLPPMPKDIVFVLDVSGSMYGQKMEQMKSAMLTILNDLQPDDRFNIITFSHHMHIWKDKLITATKENIVVAENFIESIYAFGGTNINSALLTGISELHARKDNQRVSMIFFLTDGQATSGTTNPGQIAANVLRRNKNISSIFGLAIGTGADYDLLTTICEQNSGFAWKIYEESDAALQVVSLYEEIAVVAMKDVSINYLPGSVDEHTLTNRKFPVIFIGSEVIISGKMANKANVFQMEIKGSQKSGSLDLSTNAQNVTNLIIKANDSLNTFFTMPRDLSGVMEKMWAHMTIKQYLKEKEMHPSDEAKGEELKNKILQMSLKYEFVTPLTSLVVTKPDSPDIPVESGLEDTDDHVKKSGWNQFLMQAQTSALYSKLTQAVTTPAQMLTTYPATTSIIPSDFILSAIKAEARNVSICLVLKKVNEGKYSLIQSPNGTDLHIETACLDMKCKYLLIKSLILSSNGASTVFSVGGDGHLIYQPATFFTVTETATTTNTTTISVDNLDLSVNWLEKDGAKHYTLSIKVKSEKGYKGLVGKILSDVTEKLKNKLKCQVPIRYKDFLLSAITAEVKNMSFCLPPKGVKNGINNLIKTLKGTELDIETTYFNMKCQNLLIKSIILRSNRNSTVFSVGEDGHLIYQPDTFFTVTKTTTNTTTISVDDLELSANWFDKNGVKHYNLSIKVKSKNGYKGPIAKKLNNWQNCDVPTGCQGFLLSAIKAEVNSFSYSLPPNSVKEGIHGLVRTLNGTELDIENIYSDKRCKKLSIKSIILRSNGNSTVFSVGEDGHLIYQPDTFFTVTKTTTNTTTISGDDLELSASWFEKDGAKHYTLSIKLKSEKGFKGLVAKTLNMKLNKWRKRHFPAECKDMAADFSKSLNNKKAIQYLV